MVSLILGFSLLFWLLVGVVLPVAVEPGHFSFVCGCVLLWRLWFWMTCFRCDYCWWCCDCDSFGCLDFVVSLLGLLCRCCLFSCLKLVLWFVLDVCGWLVIVLQFGWTAEFSVLFAVGLLTRLLLVRSHINSVVIYYVWICVVLLFIFCRYFVVIR